MKKIFLFLAIASTTMFVSCSDDDSSGTPAISGIVLTSDVTSVTIGQPVTFVVAESGNATNVLTTNADTKILANETLVSNGVFTATTAGTYTIKATHKNSANVTLESNTITVTVLPARYIQYNNAVTAATKGDMIYWGAYYTDATQTSIVEIFGLVTHDGDLASTTAPNNIAIVDFSMPVVNNQGNTPVAGSYNWVSPFTGLNEMQLRLNNAAVTITPTTISSVTVKIDNIAFTGQNGGLTMKYSTQATIGSGSLNTGGNGAGTIFDFTPERPAGKSSIEVFDLVKFNAKKAQFLSTKVKALKK